MCLVIFGYVGADSFKLKIIYMPTMEILNHIVIEYLKFMTGEVPLQLMIPIGEVPLKPCDCLPFSSFSSPNVLLFIFPPWSNHPLSCSLFISWLDECSSPPFYPLFICLSIFFKSTL